jgi:hypothetical protein
VVASDLVAGCDPSAGAFSRLSDWPSGSVAAGSSGMRGDSSSLRGTWDRGGFTGVTASWLATGMTRPSGQRRHCVP